MTVDFGFRSDPSGPPKPASERGCLPGLLPTATSGSPGSAVFEGVSGKDVVDPDRPV